MQLPIMEVAPMTEMMSGMEKLVNRFTAVVVMYLRGPA